MDEIFAGLGISHSRQVYNRLQAMTVAECCITVWVHWLHWICGGWVLMLLHGKAKDSQSVDHLHVYFFAYKQRSTVFRYVLLYYIPLQCIYLFWYNIFLVWYLHIWILSPKKNSNSAGMDWLSRIGGVLGSGRARSCAERCVNFRWVNR